jgi:ELWxxDGT repeat protein
MVKDINTQNSGYSSSPTYLTPMGGVLYFQANDGVNGQELWRSDGTSLGTYMVKDINTQNSGYSSSPFDLTVMGGVLYFQANDGVNGQELWRSDGTGLGTYMVKDINTQNSGYSSSPHDLTPMGSELFFVANDGVSGDELWKSDGTALGTVMVKDINTQNSGYSSDPIHLTVCGTELFFSANDGVNGFEPWMSNGTGPGTVMALDINTQNSGYSSFPDNLTPAGGLLFFAATDGVNGTELWALDCPMLITSTLVSTAQVTTVPGVVRLRWETQLSGAAQVEVQRRLGTGGAWEALGAASTEAGGAIEYQDRTIEPGKQYAYRLGIRQAAGVEFLGETAVNVPVAAFGGLRIERNPSHGSPTLTFELAPGAAGRIEIFSAAGKSMWSQAVRGGLTGASRLAVPAELSLPSGVYFARLSRGERVSRARFMVIR